MNPYTFQANAIEELLRKFKQLWSSSHHPAQLVLKSPTGSGKTFMMANFVSQLVNQPDWQHDVAFVWITFSDDLAMQSRDKFRDFFFPNHYCRMLTVADFSDGILQKNDILFLNWQKLVAQNAKDRVLRRPDDPQLYRESGYYFEDLVEKTAAAGRQIVLIIDESHTHVSELAKQKVIQPLNPKIIIKVSATPFKDASERGQFENERDAGKADIVVVKHEDVVAEGLIKEKILFQTEEDVQRYQGRDQDEMLLEMAIEKRNELVDEYKRHHLNINPLVLIQLPNDDHKLLEQGFPTKEEIVTAFLKKKGVPDSRISCWFDKKSPDPYIVQNDREIDFMLFKQAAGTGWDCPRAHVLVMFREIGSNTFYTQTLGRILRIPEPKRIHPIQSPLLKTGFVYTNYSRNQIGIPDQSTTNKPFIYISNLKYKDIAFPDCLQTDFESRVDYGDLADSNEFQKSMIQTFNKFFGIDMDTDMYYECQQKVANKGIDMSPKIYNSIMTDVEIRDIDAVNEDLSEGKDLDNETSENDLEKIFTLYCMKVLAEQTSNDAKISNIARSWSPLKSALRVWMRSAVNPNAIVCYKVFIADMQKGSGSVFRKVITQSLVDYRPILNGILAARAKGSGTSNPFKLQDSYSFTEDYEELPLSSDACVLTPFYIQKNYSGRKNEEDFILFIDPNPNIKWWFKNGDYGQEYLAFRYFHSAENKTALFYPDWLIQMKDGRIGIFDTKGGFTAADSAVKDKAEALAKRIAEMNTALGKDLFFGGIVIFENGQWYCNDAPTYHYRKGDLTGWKNLADML